MKITSVEPTRNTLIRKGMVYLTAYGDRAFAVLLFDDDLRRVMLAFKAKPGG